MRTLPKIRLAAASGTCNWLPEEKAEFRMIKAHRCPVCEREFHRDEPTGEDQFPFCSHRCRMVDLFRWSEGRYEIVEEVDPIVAQFLKDDPDIKVQGEGMEFAD